MVRFRPAPPIFPAFDSVTYGQSEVLSGALDFLGFTGLTCTVFAPRLRRPSLLDDLTETAIRELGITTLDIYNRGELVVHGKRPPQPDPKRHARARSC